APRVLRAAQDLNFVSLEHVDHPFPRRRATLRRPNPVRLPTGGQNFRKRTGQNFRSPQSCAISDERFWRASRAFDTPRCRLLYRRWLSDGDTAFELISSPAIAEALQRGTGRIESQVLRPSYRHLIPLVAPASSSVGGEQRATCPARPQPILAE